jgi:hypothetical protein
VFWVTIGSNTNLHLTLINLFSVAVTGKSGGWGHWGGKRSFLRGLGSPAAVKLDCR